MASIGSTSMASVCGGCLRLGAPIKTSMPQDLFGLVTEH